MKTISSQAGTRLAKCTHEYDLAVSKNDGTKMQDMVIKEAEAWLVSAALDAGRELTAQGFHKAEGGDA